MEPKKAETEAAEPSNLPVEFTFKDQTVRSITKDCDPWFVAADVCKALDIKDTSQATDRLDDDEKGACLIRTLGGPQKLLTINESGLYALILRSDKPKAKEFRRWVTHEVLPSIRKTGRYEADPQAKVSDQGGQTGVTVAIPGPGRWDVVVGLSGKAHVTAHQTENRQLDLILDKKDAHRRFHDLFRDGTIHPDFLLAILFERHWPLSDDNKYRFFFDETCLAMGIQDPDYAFSFIPEEHRALLTLNSFQGKRERWAVTEESLYILAFMSKKEIAKKIAQEIAALRQDNRILAQTNKSLTQAIASLVLICNQYKNDSSYPADDSLDTLVIESTINSAIEIMQQAMTGNQTINGAAF